MPAKGRKPHHDERVILFVGTTKGVFIYESDFGREKWKRSGPYLGGRAVTSIAYDHRDRKSVYVATAGGGLHRTRDLGKSWAKVGAGLPGENLSHVGLGHLSEPGSVWVGLEPAGLAKSLDGGDTFIAVPGLGECPSAKEWWGRTSGPAVTSIIVDTPNHLHVSVSVGGVFRSDDGGATFVPCNSGIAPTYPAKYEHADAHRDVHRLLSNPAKPERFYAVAERGVYRTEDAGNTWADVSAGLSSPVTRALVVSPSKPGTIFCVPLKDGKEEPPKIDGNLVVYRSTEGGDAWDRQTEGLPERLQATVYREAMQIDTLDDEGVYLATSNGLIFVSLDEGETWTQIISGIAPVLSLEVISEQD